MEKNILLALTAVFVAYAFSCRKNIYPTNDTLIIAGYPIVDTDVKAFYSNNSIISAPAEGSSFYGQDATYSGNQPSCTDNGDGTITNNVTGLMWQKADDGIARNWESSLSYAENLKFAG